MLTTATVNLVMLALGGITYAAVALIALLQPAGANRSASRMLAVYAGLGAVWNLLLELWLAQRLWFFQPAFQSRLPLYGALALAAVGYYMTRAFLRSDTRGPATWVAAGALYLALLLVVDSGLVPMGPGWPALREQVMHAGIGLGWGFWAVAALALTLRAHRRAQSALHRNRIEYWAAFLSLVLCSDGLLFVPLLAPAALLRWLAVLGIASVSFSHDLPDMRRMRQESVIYVAVLLVTTLLYFGVFQVAVGPLVAASQPFQPWVPWLGLALILAVVVSPLHRLAQWLARRLFIGANYNARQMVSEYSLAISNTVELEPLSELALGLINSAMGVEHGALYVVDRQPDPAHGDMYCLHNVKTLGAGPAEEGHLSADGPLAAHLCREHTPLTHYDIDLLPRFQSLALPERTWINSLGMDVFVPIYTQDEWIGLLALGPKRSGDRYYDDDLQQLGVLADQTAVALKNARLVADLRQLNRTLDEVNQNLAQMDRTKSEFIDIVSHELMTPLSLIMGYNQILMDDESVQSNEANRQIFEGINRGTERMRELIDTMLDAAKIDTRVLEVQSNPVSIAVPIRHVADRLRSALIERNLTLDVKDLTCLPMLETDLEALVKVFYHLVVNAVKYTPDGGHITISGRQVAADELPGISTESVEVVVADTGIGIDSEHLEMIFTKFYQTGDVISHSTGKTKFKGGGPGLGLAIVRGIVEAHGGKVWAESPGHNENLCPGSRFHVVLPLVQRH